MRSFRRLSMLPEGYVHAALSLSHMASQRLTCSRAPRREVSNRLNGRPDLARSGPEIGLQIATVRAAATVEGSAARPGHPAAGTRHRRPYLRAMWADSAPASGVAFDDDHRNTSLAHERPICSRQHDRRDSVRSRRRSEEGEVDGGRESRRRGARRHAPATATTHDDNMLLLQRHPGAGTAALEETRPA